MKKPQIGAGVRAWIFWGAPMFFFMVPVVYFFEPLAGSVGDKIAAYIVLLIGVFAVVITMVIDDYIPEKYFIPIGTIGWLLTFAFLYWYCCFGPGAFGHSTF